MEIIENVKTDILAIYNKMVDNGEISKMGYPEHDIFKRN